MTFFTVQHWTLVMIIIVPFK